MSGVQGWSHEQVNPTKDAKEVVCRFSPDEDMA